MIFPAEDGSQETIALDPSDLWGLRPPGKHRSANLASLPGEDERDEAVVALGPLRNTLRFKIAFVDGFGRGLRGPTVPFPVLEGGLDVRPDAFGKTRGESRGILARG